MPRKKNEATGRTILVVVADESGSMWDQANNVRNGFNEYIEELRKSTPNVLVTLVKFNSIVTPVYKNVIIGDVPRLDDRSYSPGGSTALNDAVATGIAIAENELTKKDKALIVIFTDGEENASIENTQEQVFKKITKRQNQENWTFVFLGADQDAWAAGARYGIAAGNTTSYASAGTSNSFRSLAHATISRTSSPAAATVDFFADAGQKPEDYLVVDDVDSNTTSSKTNTTLIPPAGTGG